MTQKLFLTSAIAMGVVAPAVAAPTYTSDTFPDGGYMQEDYTYKNAATAANMDSVYEGTVNAVAEYDVIDYILTAGKYLPKDSETITTCPAGSYCAGGETFQYSATADQGIESCPTIDDATFTSVAGSSAVTACYQEDSAMSTALLNPVTIAHLDTSVSGNGYVNGVKYKSATTTARRYATTATTAGEWAALDESDLAITDLACVNGWHFKAGLNLADAIGNIAGANRAYVRNGSFEQWADSAVAGATNHDQTFYGLTNNNTWAVYYGPDKGMVSGQARCSTQQGGNNGYTWTNPTIKSTLTDETGQDGAQYCYCNVTGYKPEGGTLQSLSSSWVFFNDYIDASNCADYCASDCAYYLRDADSYYLPFRAALLGTVPSSAAMCEANTITINWDDVDPEYAGQNNEGTATYGSDVRTPVKANTYKGKTFKGWKFSKPEQTNL